MKHTYVNTSWPKLENCPLCDHPVEYSVVDRITDEFRIQVSVCCKVCGLYSKTFSATFSGATTDVRYGREMMKAATEAAYMWNRRSYTPGWAKQEINQLKAIIKKNKEALVARVNAYQQLREECDEFINKIGVPSGGFSGFGG